MSELQRYYDSFKTGYWAHPEKDKCRCRGGGYALSEVDTWHECPYHHVPGQPHPEEWDAEWDQETERAKYEERLKSGSACPQDPSFPCYDRPCEVCTKAPSPPRDWTEKESALEFLIGPEDEDLLPF